MAAGQALERPNQTAPATSSEDRKATAVALKLGGFLMIVYGIVGVMDGWPAPGYASGLGLALFVAGRFLD